MCTAIYIPTKHSALIMISLDWQACVRIVLTLLRLFGLYEDFQMTFHMGKPSEYHQACSIPPWEGRWGGAKC